MFLQNSFPKCRSSCSQMFFRSSRHPEVFCKKLFREISQNSQENTCARVSLLLSCRQRSATFLKKKPWHRCFLWILWNFEEHLFLQNTSLWWLLLVLQNRCSYKFPYIHQKISVLKFFFNTVRGLKAHNFNKKQTPTQVFSCEYHKFLKIPVL